MLDEVIEKHQVAGLDDRARGFTRLVEVARSEGGYRASLRYETTMVVTGGTETKLAAVQEVIHLLQIRGFTQLRSQLSFSGSTYLGSQEPWIEYLDPERPPEPTWGLFGWIRRWLSRYNPI